MGAASFNQGQSSNPQLTHNQPRNNKYARHYYAALVDVFQIDDLLDFSNEDIAGPIGTEADSLLAVNSCSSSLPAPVPSSVAAVQQKAEAFDHLQAAAASSYDDLEELEWASRFLDDSFPQQKYEKATSPVSVLEQQTSATSSELTSTGSEHSLDHFCTAVTVPGRARSKRSRSSAGGKKWTSGMILPSTATTTTTTTSSAVLRCRHCQTQRTPQWRTGPMGPKTLCNACGVRYKSGRLLPEYRPASSPAYIPHKHSNSHKKVLEMRRQRELTEA
ncbi:unnamed protein product [Sphagnum tenellum]